MMRLTEMSPEQALRYFEMRLPGGLRRGGREHEYIARCPFHDDRNPSFSFNVEKKVWKCFAECGGGTILQFERRLTSCDELQARKNIGEIIGEELPSVHGPGEGCKTFYDYTDEQNNLLVQIVRTNPANGAGKKFVQRRKGENGQWIYNLDGVRKVLYRLPEIITAKEVFVVEGEKCAERLRVALAEFGAKNVAVTCNPGGAGKWSEDYSRFLIGKTVVITPDNDDVGRSHAQQVAVSATGFAVGVKVVELPGVPESGDVADFLDNGGSVSQLSELIKQAPLWKASAEAEEQAIPEDGAALLDDISTFIQRYVSLTQAQADSIALWAAHTHALAAADYTPYLEINSAVPRSGKSRLLEVLDLLVARPWKTGRTTAAALVRKIDKDQPILLLDESDAAFKAEHEYAEALRGILNSGFERGGKSSLCVRTGSDWEVRDFSTFSPKAIAGIGRLPDTVRDRAIPIRLKRKLRSEACTRFRKKIIRPEADGLRERLSRWAEQNLQILREHGPVLPNELNDRQQDVCEPLLVIADLVGGEWPSRARRALVELCTGEAAQDDSILVRLLGDIRDAFDSRGTERVSSSDLLLDLTGDETTPWVDWKNGKPLTAAQLAKLLKQVDISPRGVRIGDKTPKGYLRADFEDAWARYLPDTQDTQVEAQQPPQTNVYAGSPRFSEAQQKPSVADKKGAESLQSTRVVADVAASEPEEEMAEEML